MRLLHVLLTLLIFLPLFPLHARSSDDNKSPVYKIDLWKLFETEGFETTEARANLIYLLTSLQGLVNRDEPNLFINCSLNLIGGELDYTHEIEPGTKIVAQEVDTKWWDWIEQKGWMDGRKVVQLDSLEEVLTTFHGIYDGYVLWTMESPSTVNLALTAAGVESLLPLSKDLDDGFLFERLQGITPEVPVICDFTQLAAKKGFAVDGKNFASSGSAKVDTYRLMIERYIRPGRTNPFYLYYNVDAAALGRLRSFYGKAEFGHLGDRNELQQDGLYNNDYWVSKRGVFLDLFPFKDELPNDDPAQPLGADETLWHDILELSYRQRSGEFGTIGGFVPWWVKYAVRQSDGKKRKDVVSLEVRFIALASSYNLWNDADAAFGISNASFYQHFEKPDPTLFLNPNGDSDKEPEEGHAYVSLFMLDYDGSSWLNQAALSVYDTPGRGEIALNWAINPLLADRVPQAFHYILEKRTDRDFFGMSGDGAGYIDPYYLVEGQRLGRIQVSGLPFYLKAARPYYDEQMIKLTAFQITSGFDREWLQAMFEQSPVGLGLNRQPTIDMSDFPPTQTLLQVHHRNLADMERQLEEVYRRSEARGIASPEFYGFRCILVRPAYVVDMVKRLEAKYPKAQVEIVDAFSFYDLKQKAKEQSLLSDQVFVRAAQVCARANRYEGMRPVQVADGPFRVENVAGEDTWLLPAEPGKFCYFYVDINDGFGGSLDHGETRLDLEFTAQAQVDIGVQYNASQADGQVRPYANAGPVKPLGPLSRGSVSFVLEDVLFRNAQNGGTDLRLVIHSSKPLLIHSICLRACN